MFNRKSDALTRSGIFVDPFMLLDRMTTDFDRLFTETGWPAFRTRGKTEPVAWSPHLDVFEKDNRLVARADLPGMKKEDVKVEVNDGYLAISGERKYETEEKKENVYRCEREYGTFYRAFPLPEGVRADAVKATFENGVLEVSIPLAVRTESKPRAIRIEEPAKPTKAA